MITPPQWGGRIKIYGSRGTILIVLASNVMRKQIMDSLRYAGDEVRNFDDAYASKLANYIASFNPKTASPSQGVQVAAGLVAGVPATRKFAVEEENDLLRALMGYGVPAVNAGVRYGVPAAGLYGGAQGLNALYNAASQMSVPGNNPQNQVDEGQLMVRY